MKKIFINSINKLLVLDKPITTIKVESASLYRTMLQDFEENFIYSINDAPVDLLKHSIIILNPFQISINDAKFIKILYKQLENEIKYCNLNDEMENYLVEVIDDISKKTEIPIDYNLNLNYNKLLSAMDIMYKEPETYLEKLVYYIKLNKQLYNSTLIISVGLLYLLEHSEIELLKKELRYLDISLLDIQYFNKEINHDILIDDEWCIV